MKEIALTVLSNGAGQDTTYLIHRLLHDQAFYNKHVQGRLLIVGSNTGNEHDHTYENVEFRGYKYAIPEHQPIKLSSGLFLHTYKLTKYDNEGMSLHEDWDEEQDAFDREVG